MLGDGAETVSVRAESPNESDSALLLGQRSQHPARPELPPEWRAPPAHGQAPRPTIGDHFLHPFGTAEAFKLRGGGQDAEHQLRDSVRRAIATQVQQVERDFPSLELFEHLQRVGGAAKHAIQLRADHRVAELHRRQERTALGTLTQRLAPRDAFLDVDVIDGLAQLQRPTLDLPALHVEAFAVLDLSDGTHSRVAERLCDAHSHE